MRRRLTCGLGFLICAVAFFASPASLHAQQLSRRLILKDGSYQLVTKYEVKGDRVHYLSAERGEWEELPNSLVDWKATEDYEKSRSAGAATPEAAELDKELESEKKEDELLHPHVAPGLELPDTGGVFLLDNFQNEPQLVPIDQSSSEVKKNTKDNILRGAINPVAGAKQTIELPGEHATVQSHVPVPSIYVNVSDDSSANSSGNGPQQPQKPQEPQLPFDRYKIVRMQAKNGKRIVGDIKIAAYGKMSQEQNLVPATAQELTGGWVKITPIQSLDPGEYALVEMLGKEGMNLLVWDFGVNPKAPINGAAWRPSQPPPTPAPEKDVELEKRPQ